MVIAAVFALMLSAVGCGDDSGSDAGGTFTPKHAGVLTVITSLPAPGFWDGPDVDNLTGAVRLYTRAGMSPDPRLVVWQREGSRPAD